MTLRADGTLGPPFGKNDPFDPARVIDRYNEFPPFYQQAMTSFIEAMRLAQPFRLPPPGTETYPARLYVDFLLHDL